MKDDNENIKLFHKRKRKMKKIRLGIISLFLIIIGILTIATYFFFNQKEILNYKETAEIDYRVNLIENEFYPENYLDKGIDVIANLIENIDVDFKYELDMQKEIEYEYNYKILAKTNVKERTKTNLLYEAEHELLNKETQKVNSNKLTIEEKINLDYNKYNEEVNKLLEVYKLKDTTSELYLKMFLEVKNVATGEVINKDNNIMTVEMPLTTPTVEISINENSEGEGKTIIKKGMLEEFEYIIGIGVLIAVAGFGVFIMLIKYILDTRSAEKMYNDELKKILFDYKSYIQKINNKIDYNEYKVINIDTFKELMEMREEIQSPILMYTEERKTTFIMLNGNLLFEHILAAELIRENLIKKSKEKQRKKENKK